MSSQDLSKRDGHKIELQLGKSVYVNGEEILGSVTLRLKKNLPVKVIKTRVGGFEKAVIYIPPNANINKNTPFFWHDTVVWNPGIEDQEELEAGTYNFPFSIQLPPHLPPSFNHNNLVSIVYLASCFIETNGDLIPSNTMDFNIYGTLPAKWEDVVRNSKPCTAKANKVFLFHKSKPLELSAHLVQTDFQIGDTVTIHTQVRNHSTTTLDSIVVSLIQHVHVDAEELNREMPKTKLLSLPFSCPITQYSKLNPKTKFSLDIIIPQISGEDEVYPTTVGKTIKVTYSIKVTLPGPELSVEFPIVLWDKQVNTITVASTGPTSSSVAAPQSITKVEWEIDWLPEWIDDEVVSQCLSCNQTFTVFNRKHHCRCCGLVFCTKCTPHKVAMKHLGYIDPVRICTKCHTSIPLAEQQTAEEGLDDTIP